MQYNRGGKSLKVGDIGKMSILRQHILLPGEKMKTTIKGNVRLSGLKQQTSVYLNAGIEAFAAPLRWYYTGFPTYLKEGVTTAETIPVMTAPTVGDEEEWASHIGIGVINDDFCKWFIQNPIKIWNEYYRWHEDSRESVTTPLYSFYSGQGKSCVNLPTAATRMHAQPTVHADESLVPSTSTLDVRTLQQYQARFNQAASTDWTGGDRYQVFMKDIYGAKGNNEVDQIPTRLRQGASLGVSPRDMYATDGASLGEIMSINNFEVDHSWGDYIAPEHMIIAYIMVLRFAPIMEDGVQPGIYPGQTPYSVYQGDANIIANKAPEPIASREIDSDGDDTIIGYLPSGWQYREGYNHIDRTIRSTKAFPLLDGQTATAAGYRDAGKINDAFRTSVLRDWFGDLDFTIQVDSRIAPAGQSIMVGGDGGKTPKGNHPTGGYLI